MKKFGSFIMKRTNVVNFVKNILFHNARILFNGANIKVKFEMKKYLT